jgi:hypothetical protein
MSKIIETTENTLNVEPLFNNTTKSDYSILLKK